MFSTLAGAAGAGLTTYGNILKDKEEKDWEAQKDQINYSRQQALEGLRAGYARETQGMQNEYATGERIRQEGVAKENLGETRTYEAKQLEESRAYELRQKGQERAERRKDVEWELGLKKGVDKDKYAEQLQLKKDTWQEFVDEGGTDNMTEDQAMATKASYILGITPPTSKTVKPTDEMFKIASELVQASAPEGTSAQDMQASIQTVAWGLAVDPRGTKRVIGADGGEGRYDEQSDLPKLQQIASRAAQGNTGAKQQLDSMLNTLQGAVSKKRYNEIVSKLNMPKGEEEPKGAMASVTAKTGTANTSMRGAPAPITMKKTTSQSMLDAAANDPVALESQWRSENPKRANETMKNYKLRMAEGVKQLQRG